jgi:hypothetical protein
LGRSSAAQPGDAGPDQDDRQPGHHPPVEAALEQLKRQRARSDEEDEDPDRPMGKAVADLVSRAKAAIRGELDADGMAERTFVGRG